MQSLADVCIDSNTVIPPSYDNPKAVYCNSADFSVLKEKLHNFKNPFILVTNSIGADDEILLYTNKIMRCYTLDTTLTNYRVHVIAAGEEDKYRDELRRFVPRKVLFLPIGRSGNNIFQYIASEVMRYIFRFDLVEMTETRDHPGAIRFHNAPYKIITANYLSNTAQIPSLMNEILMDGFFQYSDILLHLRGEIIKYFNTLNMTPINKTFTVADFSRKETKHVIDESDTAPLIVHLRLDDFIHSNRPPNIFDKVELSKYIDTIPFSKLYIVCDALREDWEKKYVDYFMKKYDAVFLSGSLMDDFNCLKNAKRLVTSQSTYAWIAAYLGNADEVFIPYSNFYRNDQILAECHGNCKVKYDIPFAADLRT